MRRLQDLALAVLRPLCWLRFHDWRNVTLDGRPHVVGRACGRCPAKQRKLGNGWMPCSSTWGWLPEGDNR